MTLTDILDSMPSIVVNRFSNNSNKFWISALGDILCDLDNLCCGPWNTTSAMVVPMSSGYFKRPKSIVKFEGYELTSTNEVYRDKKFIKELDKRGFFLNDEINRFASYGSMNVLVSSSDENTVTIHSIKSMLADGVVMSVTPGYTDELDFKNGNALHYVIKITNTDLVKINGALDGRKLQPTSGRFESIYAHIVSSSFLSSTDAYEMWDVFVDSEFGRFNYGVDTFTIETIIESPFGSGIMGVESDEDYSEIMVGSSSQFPATFDRIKPGRVFSPKYGRLIKSNLKVIGPSATYKPSSLTENLDVPDEWDHLIRLGLLWKAECQDGISSQDARTAKMLYSESTREYISKLADVKGDCFVPELKGATLTFGEFL